MLFKRNRIPFTIPDDARELSEEEMVQVNGGAEEKKESQESKSESVTVQSGNTLSGIVSDYNKANGTNYTVSDVAKNSGISNPDVIYPGQEIKFGSSSSTSGTSGSSNISTSSSASSSSVSMTNIGNTCASNKTKDSSHHSAYDQQFINEMMEKEQKSAVGGNGIQGTAVSGKAVKGNQTTANQGAGTMTVTDYIEQQRKMGAGATVPGQAVGNLTEQGYPSSRDANSGIYVDKEEEKRKNGLTKIKSSIEQNQKHKYNDNDDGFMCDNWVEEVIDDAGYDSTKYLPAGNSYKNECIKHIEEAQKASSGFTTTLPTEDGAYVVYMGEGHKVLNQKTNEYKPLREHAALLVIEDGAMTIWDNSSGNKVVIDGETYNVDKTSVGMRSSTQISVFGYDLYYYKSIL
ncbi:MAG: LysM peptidoglycan-binding domain-containing protein [Treponema sp.]|nr:LysM peptidoglycan-binding domain-containing protein [Treponema sp.]